MLILQTFYQKMSLRWVYPVAILFASGIFVIFLLTASFLASETQAKVLPQAQKAKKSTTKFSTSSTIGVFPKLRADRKALIVNYSNLQNATQVSYLLTYKTAVQEEGAMGGLNLTGVSQSSSELLFGTCSKNICRYHTSIKNARLEVSYSSKSGKKYLKKFRIKV